MGWWAVTDSSTCPLSSAITALAPRWPRRACSQCVTARNAHSADNINSEPSQQRRHRAEGSLATRATMLASTIADAMAQPEMTTPQVTEAIR
ncbi:hypothetical protein MPSD_24640 [Mycobacterium pseudoshottsii JCM 15466]|uniref:Uncharacterized protein n=1 Tax=Mycobacterium pseudoshottsii TaxID=265949 RepID=A0A9N7QMT0_9MYCO|nr:hypothetical protein MPSD_24640 [Mycobacterium pseudoshottsii JCM 15466]BDN82220.1 hypothetical protein NJB1907Z4_C24350 [Mycobacterium pseudoshottsii]